MSGFRSSGQPGYMTTGELEQMTGFKRGRLDNYVEHGIVAPFKDNSRAGADKRWSLQQAWLLKHVSAMLSTEMPLDKAASLIEASQAEMADAIIAHYSGAIREAKRARAAVMLREELVADTLFACGIDGYYVRYIPQRSLAIAPALTEEEGRGGKRTAKLCIDIMSVAQVAGWSMTESMGTVASCSGSGNESQFACVPLSCTPLPLPELNSGDSTGCYRIFQGHLTEACRQCPLFGREPTPKERFVWKERERGRDELWRHCRIAGDEEPQCPMEQGMRLEAIVREDTKPLIVPRPHVMRQHARLPMGVTVLTMPAGFYLCLQSDASEMSRSMNRMKDIVSSLPRKSLREQEEGYLKRAKYHPAELAITENGSFKARAPRIGILDYAGMQSLLGLKEIGQLEVAGEAGILPGDDLCVCSVEIPPLDRNDRPRYEAQCLLSISEPPPHVRFEC